MQTPWDHRFAQRTQRMGSSAIRELLKLTEEPDIISFGGGMPAPDVFPADEMSEACARVLRDIGDLALQYGSTEGFRPLREMIVRHTARYGIQVTPDNVLITSGSQQALDLLGKILINPGDRILVESPTYLGALQAWSAYGAEYVTVPMDENGMVTDALDNALRSGVKFIYVLPNFQNPTGVTLSLERRQQLIEIADRYGVTEHIAWVNDPRIPIIDGDRNRFLCVQKRHVAHHPAGRITYRRGCRVVGRLFGEGTAARSGAGDKALVANRSTI